MKTLTFAWVTTLALAFGCKEQPNTSTPVEVSTPKPVAMPKSSLPQPLVAKQLERFAKVLQCKTTKEPVALKWCNGIQGWDNATHDASALPDKDVVFVGLTQYIDLAKSIDVAQQAPAVLGIKHASSGHKGDLVRVSSRKKKHVNQVRGMRFQVRRSLSGDPRPVVLTDPKLYTYVTQAPGRATLNLKPHQAGWQLAAGSRFDLRKVGDLWMGIHEPHVKKGEAPGVHVYMLQTVPVSNVAPQAADVDVRALRARLTCDETPETLGCNVLKGFEGAKRPKKEGLWVGSLVGTRSTSQPGMIAVQLTGTSEAMKAKMLYSSTVSVNPKKGPVDPTILAELQKLPSADTLSPVGGTTLLLKQRVDFGEQKNINAYTYLRAHDGVLYAIVSDPFGGERWFATLSR